MPSTLQTPKGTRCIRCATLIRNSRKNCPSCDLDFSASNSAPPSNGNSKSNSKVISRVGSRVGGAVSPAADSSARKNRAARTGMRLCPVCMSSVNEAEMSESSGQMVCNACAVKLKNKPARGPLAAGAVASNSAPPQMVSKSEPEPRPVSNGGLPSKPIMSDDELLTAKGMQRQLKDKLVWIKVLVIIWGILNIMFGGFAYVTGALGGAVVSAIDKRMEKDDDKLTKLDLVDEDGNQISVEEAKLQREKDREEAREFANEAKSAVFKWKLAAVLSIFSGICFFVAFFMMNQKPYEVCAIVTVLYVLSKVTGAALLGLEHFEILDVFIIICTLSTLVTGIRTGMRIKDIRDRAEAATGRPVIA